MTLSWKRWRPRKVLVSWTVWHWWSVQMLEVIFRPLLGCTDQNVLVNCLHHWCYLWLAQTLNMLLAFAVFLWWFRPLFSLVLSCSTNLIVSAYKKFSLNIEPQRMTCERLLPLLFYLFAPYWHFSHVEISQHCVRLLVSSNTHVRLTWIKSSDFVFNRHIACIS